MSKLLLLLLLVACERARPAPSVAPTPQDAAVEDAAIEDAPEDAAFEEECEDRGSAEITIRGVHGTISVTECKVGKGSDNEEAAAQGFVWDEMEGRLVFQPASGDPDTWVFSDWTDGWEWGWSPELIGVLVSRSGEAAILIGGHGHSPAAGWKGQAEQIDAYRIVDGELEQTNKFSATAMKAVIAPDRRSARVEWCQPAEDPDHPKGCMDVDDADPMRPFTMRFNGTKVTTH